MSAFVQKALMASAVVTGIILAVVLKYVVGTSDLTALFVGVGFIAAELTVFRFLFERIGTSSPRDDDRIG